MDELPVVREQAGEFQCLLETPAPARSGNRELFRGLHCSNRVLLVGQCAPNDFRYLQRPNVTVVAYSSITRRSAVTLDLSVNQVSLHVDQGEASTQDG